ncbi:hypothetical protein AMTRI_Chr09g35800 [Amborella trichopoda]
MAELELPGFRFHPTEEEILGFYLKRVALGNSLQFDIIGTLDLYRHDPWELPALANIGEREWYFFVPRDRKHPNGGRPNRITKNGFWKATGSDRRIRSGSDPKCVLGLKKTLVFYTGRAPKGCKTDWVMNEYRLLESYPVPKKDIVMCKIYRKVTSLKVLEQRAAMEKDKATPPQSGCVTPAHATPSPSYQEVDTENQANYARMETSEVKEEAETASTTHEKQEERPRLAELQMPKLCMDWMHDPAFTQLRSPWGELLLTPYPSLLNF